MKLPAHNRYDYVPITRRPVYDWPEGKRLAVFFCNNIEHFAFGRGLGSDSTGADVAQNQRNYAWRDYGNRVGIWYYLDFLDEFALPGAHNVNSAVLEYCPDIVERLNGRGDEYVGHGRTNSERQDILWEEDEARLIAECTEIVTRLSGKKPEGWLGPYLAQSGVTLDLLKEAGYRYVMDWALDDQPVWMRTRSGPILSVPYPIECNDLPAQFFRRHTGRQFAEMVIDQFDEMLDQSQEIPAGVQRRVAPVHHRPAVPPARLPPRHGAHPGASRRFMDHHSRRDRALLREPAAGHRAGELIPTARARSGNAQPRRKPGSTIRQLPGCPPMDPGFRRDCEQVGSIRTNALGSKRARQRNAARAPADGGKMVSRLYERHRYPE